MERFSEELHTRQEGHKVVELKLKKIYIIYVCIIYYFDNSWQYLILKLLVLIIFGKTFLCHFVVLQFSLEYACLGTGGWTTRQNVLTVMRMRD